MDLNDINEYPPVTILGDGLYAGIISGCIFNYNGKRYRCSFGIRGMNIPFVVKVENGKDSRG